MNRILFSSGTDEWSTPQDIFDKLNAEFSFTLDPCATDENHKCDKWFTKEEDGLQKSWGGGRAYSAILPTGENFRGGFVRRMRRARRTTRWWSC